MNAATVHLIDRLPSARVAAPGPDHVGVQRMTAGRDPRMAIFAHPRSRVVFDGLVILPGARLVGAAGLRDVCGERVRAPVDFTIRIAAGGRPRRIWRARVDARLAADRRWHEFDLELPSGAERPFRLILETSTPIGRSARFAWAGWADPRLVGTPRPEVRPACEPDPCLVVVTADELRADHLGCYGHPEARTPNLDALAAGGWRFAEARSGTGNTLEAYADLLTGNDHRRHGIRSEWGRLAGGVPTLADLARAGGFRSAAFTSETELAGAPGLWQGFDELHPGPGHPAQDGAITVRRFEDWLDRRPAGPFLAWIHLFDSHQPFAAPEPFRSMDYAGDPTDPARAHRPETLARIRGVESLQEFHENLPLLDRGVPSDALTDRFLATIECLRGLSPSGPDLAPHVRNLGPTARRGLAVPDFCDWLETQVAALREGRVPPELPAWMRTVAGLLEPVDADILGWLDGVVDFRYALAQYRAAIRYVDAHAGRIVAALAARGLHEDATIVFTAPHGQMLDERDCVFYNHALHESVLSIPLLVKPGRRPAGRVVRGLFRGVDLAPTLCDAMGWPLPSPAEGRSHWEDLVAGRDLPVRPSFASDRFSACVRDGTDKLYRFTGTHRVSDRWSWRAGQTAYFDLAGPGGEETEARPAPPERAARLESLLQESTR